MKLKNIIKILFYKILEILSPVKNAKFKGVKYGENLKLYGKIKWGSEPWLISIGNNVHITDGVRFITHDGGTLIFRDQIPDLEITKPILLGDNIYIGVKSIILPGVTIGNNVVIGAGSIVTKDVPDNSVVAGVPARFIKDTNVYLEGLKLESLHIGHLSAHDKEIALKKYYNI